MINILKTKIHVYTTMELKEYLNEYYLNNSISFPNDITEFIQKFSVFIELVNYWSQILGLVLFKSSYPSNRINIIKNLIDENLEMAHVETFYNFLLECGMNKEININKLILNGKENKLIIEYKKNIFDFVNNNNYSNVVEALSAIEYIYHLISIDINKYYKHFFGINPNYHFNMHEIIDQTHFIELLKCSENLTPNMKSIEFGANWIIQSIKKILE